MVKILDVLGEVHLILIIKYKTEFLSFELIFINKGAFFSLRKGLSRRISVESIWIKRRREKRKKEGWSPTTTSPFF
jgi:hypothetical protein